MGRRLQRRVRLPAGELRVATGVRSQFAGICPRPGLARPWAESSPASNGGFFESQNNDNSEPSYNRVVGKLYLREDDMTVCVRGVRSARCLIITMVFAIACSDAGESQMPTGPTPTAIPGGWQTYSDPIYGFSISYPSSYTILPDSAPPNPGAVKRLRFQDRQIATSPFADREPERFLVEVFPLAQATSLEAWLRSAGKLPADAVASAFSWPGAAEATRVRQRMALMPNEFYYFSTNRWVYALTPSADGVTMLGTFVLAP